jgi:hypothetical protein
VVSRSSFRGTDTLARTGIDEEGIGGVAISGDKGAVRAMQDDRLPTTDEKEDI